MSVFTHKRSDRTEYRLWKGWKNSRVENLSYRVGERLGLDRTKLDQIKLLIGFSTNRPLCLIKFLFKPIQLVRENAHFVFMEWSMNSEMMS